MCTQWGGGRGGLKGFDYRPVHSGEGGGVVSRGLTTDLYTVGRGEGGLKGFDHRPVHSGEGGGVDSRGLTNLPLCTYRTENKLLEDEMERIQLTITMTDALYGYIQDIHKWNHIRGASTVWCNPLCEPCVRVWTSITCGDSHNNTSGKFSLVLHLFVCPLHVNNSLHDFVENQTVQSIIKHTNLLIFHFFQIKRITTD